MLLLVAIKTIWNRLAGEMAQFETFNEPINDCTFGLLGERKTLANFLPLEFSALYQASAINKICRLNRIIYSAKSTLIPVIGHFRWH